MSLTSLDVYGIFPRFDCQAMFRTTICIFRNDVSLPERALRVNQYEWGFLKRRALRR